MYYTNGIYQPPIETQPMMNPQISYGAQPNLNYAPAYNPYSYNYPVPLDNNNNINNNYQIGYQPVQQNPVYGQQPYGGQYPPPQYAANQNYYVQPQYNQPVGYNNGNQL